MNQNIGLSGIPMVGNDIGGFAQRPSAELMKRRLEVGALMPFARVHYDSDIKSTVKQGQEPFAEVFGGDQQVETIARQYVRLRYWTGKTYAGGRYIERQTGIETLPLYVRGGSIIPRRETQLYTGEKPLTNLILDTWMSANGSASAGYYEDDGATKAYQEGTYNETAFTVRREDGGFTLSVRPLRRGYQSATSTYTLQLHDVTDSPVPSATAVTSSSSRRVKVRYDRAAKVLRVRAPASTRRLHVKLR